jgi:uncharacterized protein (DUF1697 family)
MSEAAGMWSVRSSQGGGWCGGGCGRVGAMGDDRYYAFLRAINTGNRRLSNEQLLAPFNELGFTDVAAYQAAGNVTFRSAAPDLVDEVRIEAAIAAAYGFHAPTFVRTAAEIQSIASSERFSTEELADTAGKVQVTFLRATPPPDVIAQLMALVPGEDCVVVSGREWYWLPVGGVSASALPVGRIESLLGEMTMRTLGTLRRMADRFEEQ